MPLATETLTHKPLASEELRSIILADVTEVLRTSGLTSGQVAYGRVSYEVRLTIHTDNPAMPRQQEVVRSRRRSTNDTDKNPQLAAIESLPLANTTPESGFVSRERHREIENPNFARVEAGLPVTIHKRGQNSETIEQSVNYPKEKLENDPNPPPTDRDVTVQARQELGVEEKKNG